MFPCPYLPHPPPTNSQTEKQTGQRAWAVLTGAADPLLLSSTLTLFATTFFQAAPLCFCSSHPKGITLMFMLKAVSPYSFSVFQECPSGPWIAWDGGTCWPGEPQCFQAEPLILDIWVRNPKWTSLFLLQANLWPLHETLPETLNSGLYREGNITKRRKS